MKSNCVLKESCEESQKKLMLDMNELGYALPKKVQNGLSSYPLDYRRYGCRTDYHKELRSKMADCLQLQPENFVITHGSDDALKIIIETCLSDGDEVITVEPSYQYHWMWLDQKNIKRTSYRNISNTAELEQLKVPATTKMLYFCNPNNPTGRIVDREVVRKICENNSHCLVLVDEAYAEYHTDIEVISEQLEKAAMEQTNRSLSNVIDNFLSKRKAPVWLYDDVSSSHFTDDENAEVMKLPWWSAATLKLPNLIVSRTFSKAYGIAGLRLGYVVDAGCKDRCAKLDVNYSRKTLTEVALLGGNLVMDNKLSYADIIRKNFFCQMVFVEFLKRNFYKGVDTVKEYNFLTTRSYEEPNLDENELKFFVGEGPYVLFSVPKDLQFEGSEGDARIGFLQHMRNVEGIYFRDQHHNIPGTVRINMCSVTDLNRVLQAMDRVVPVSRK